jgi:hypothetical protein
LAGWQFGGWFFNLLTAAAVGVFAQVLDDDGGVSTTHVAQVGVDAWRLSPKTPKTLLMLPTNSEWH